MNGGGRGRGIPSTTNPKGFSFLNEFRNYTATYTATLGLASDVMSSSDCDVGLFDVTSEFLSQSILDLEMG